MSAAAPAFSGRALSRNALWSVAADATPFVFAIAAVPMLIHLIGPERFGLLSIVWVLVGYFNLFDLGLNRAITHFAAKAIGAGRPEEVPQILWSGMAMMMAVGGAAALGLLFFAAQAASWLKVSPQHEAETIYAIRWLALAIPFVIAGNAFKGVLQARQRFKAVSAVQIPLGACIFLGPVLVAWLGFPQISALAFGLAASRIAAAAAFYWHAREGLAVEGAPAVTRAQLIPMLKYSGWIASSNFIGPLLVNFDRLFISRMLGATAVAHYAAPFDAIFRTAVVPHAIAAAVFPSVSATHASDAAAVRSAASLALQTVFIVMFPCYLFAAAFSREILFYWINLEFSDAGHVVLTVLAAGMFMNSVALIPSSVVQGSGRSDLTAIGHMIEIPFYMAALYFVVPVFGIVGAAVVWSGRVLMDMILIFGFSAYVQSSLREMGMQSVLGVIAGVALIVLTPQIDSAMLRAAIVAASCAVSTLYLWRLYHSAFGGAH
jgi:O-antigen/teichoic acid export membrane protein